MLCLHRKDTLKIQRKAAIGTQIAAVQIARAIPMFLRLSYIAHVRIKRITMPRVSVYLSYTIHRQWTLSTFSSQKFNIDKHCVYKS